MLILGIESSCDETSCAVAEMSDGRAASPLLRIDSQIETHARYGGVVPEIASRRPCGGNLPRCHFRCEGQRRFPIRN